MDEISFVLVDRLTSMSSQTSFFPQELLSAGVCIGKVRVGGVLW